MPDETVSESSTDEAPQEVAKPVSQETAAEAEEAAEATKPAAENTVPYSRFSEVVRQKNEIAERLKRIERDLANRDDFLEKARPALEMMARLAAAREFDPRVRDLMRDHWIFTGREPGEEDIDDVRAYARYLASLETGRNQSEWESEEESAGDEAELERRWSEEEKQISEDPLLGPLATEERLAKTYEHIQELARQGQDMTSASFARIFRDLWHDDILEAAREAGRKEALEKASKKPPASLKPGTVSTTLPKDLSRLPIRDHIRAVIEAGA